MSYNTFMIKLLLFTITFLLLTGCANKRGISMKYYNECREYYDLQGSYHKVCPENMVEYEEIKDIFKDKEEPCVGENCPNVW